MTTCKHCADTWTGARISHCAGCCRTFTTVPNFDRHRRDFACLDPVEVGLERNERGQWSSPPPEHPHWSTDSPTSSVTETAQNATLDTLCPDGVL